jgi:hypothetical protein
MTNRTVLRAVSARRYKRRTDQLAANRFTSRLDESRGSLGSGALHPAPGCFQESISMRTTDPVGPPPLWAGAMLQFET